MKYFIKKQIKRVLRRPIDNSLVQNTVDIEKIGKLNADEVKKMYLKGGARYKFYGMENNEMRNKLRKFCKNLNPESVFEFGCNVGMNLKKISKNHYGIDINKEAIEKGKDRGLNVELGDENTLSQMKSDSFDLVLTSSVLDHVVDDDFDHIFENLKRITKKYLVCLETNDEIDVNLFAHDYSLMKPMWTYFSSREKRGNGCNYTCYLWLKKTKKKL